MINSYTNKIIIVDKPFLQKLEYLSETDYQQFINPDIDTQIITLPMSPDQTRELVSYIDPSDIRPGNVLLKPSYTGSFTTIDKFSEDVVFQKFGLFVQLNIALGAKEVTVDSVEDVKLDSEDNKRFKAEISGESPFVKGQANVDSDESASVSDIKKSIMRMGTKAQGSEPDFEEADRIMTQYGLAKDSLFSDIYNMRRSLKNPLKTHSIELDFSNDLKKAFDSSLSASVSVMSKIYKGSASFESVKSSLNNIKSATKLNITVTF